MYFIYSNTWCVESTLGALKLGVLNRVIQMTDLTVTITEDSPTILLDMYITATLSLFLSMHTSHGSQLTTLPMVNCDLCMDVSRVTCIIIYFYL